MINILIAIDNIYWVRTIYHYLLYFFGKNDMYN